MEKIEQFENYLHLIGMLDTILLCANYLYYV